MATFKAESMPLFVEPFLIDTAELDNSAVGAYTRLLLYQWRNGDLPADVPALARLACESPTRFKKIWEKISKKFEFFGEKRCRNAKLAAVRKEKDDFRVTLSESGALGAAKRWGGHREAKGEAKAPANPPPYAKYKYKIILPNGSIDFASKKRMAEFLPAPNFPPAPLSAAPPPPTKKKRRASAARNYKSDSHSGYPFLKFWEDYEKAVDKDKAYDEYQKLNETDRALIMQNIPLYKIAQPVKQYRKNPEGYLKNRRWESEIVTGAAAGSKLPVIPAVGFSHIPAASIEADDLKKHYEYKPGQ